VGGSFSLNVSNVNQVDVRTTTIIVNPDFGYFFIPKLAGGARVVYSRTKGSGVWYPPSSNLAVSPFLRYYILPANNKINMLTEAKINW
jgi:hypothetical protein